MSIPDWLKVIGLVLLLCIYLYVFFIIVKNIVPLHAYMRIHTKTMENNSRHNVITLVMCKKIYCLSWVV